MIKDPKQPESPPAPRRRPFAKPRIAWREPYEPVSFGLSCARLPGLPGCAPPRT